MNRRLVAWLLTTIMVFTFFAAAVGPSIATKEKTTVVEPDIVWQDTYGDDDLFAHDVIETGDGNFATTGEFIFFSPNAIEGGAIYLLKTAGSDGEKLSQTFESHGFARFYSGEFIQQAEDGFIVAGSGTELLPPTSFFYLVKYDEDGNVIWSNSYRPVGGNCSCTGATGTPDGGYLLVGNTIEPSSAAYVYVVKTDALGNKQWDTVIADPAGLGVSSAIPRSVTNAPGGYAITGEVLNEEAGLNEAFFLRLNANGKVIAKEHYIFALPNTLKTEMDGASIQYTNDGFIIAGRAYGYGLIGINAKAAFLLKVSVNGNVRWFNTYGRSEFSGASSVALTADGGYIITGTTNFITPGSPIFMYIARMDPDGNLLWSKTISEKSPLIRYATSSGSKVKVTSDGGYIVAGMAVPGGSADTLLVRLEPDIVPLE